MDAGTPGSKLEIALAYAARGWKVFPLYSIADGECACFEGVTCKSAGKHPLTANGVDAASSNEIIIRGWWRNEPDANVGIATGKGSGLIAVDIDPRNGGDKTWADLVEKCGEPPNAAVVDTGGGGVHRFFAYEDGVSYPGKLGVGVDLKSDGGYVVAAGSVHLSGKLYAWRTNGAWRQALPKLPSAFLAAAPKTAKSVGKATDDQIHVKRHIESWLLQHRVEFHVTPLEPLKIVLERCVFNPEHKQMAIWVGHPEKLGSTTIRASCFHNSCNANRDVWEGVRQQIGGWSEPTRLRPWISTAERALTIAERGVHLQTEFTTFNEITRGGPITGKLIVFGGAPGSGKTTLLAQLGWALAEFAVVCFLAADEEANGILTRVGQLEGFDRNLLEAPTPIGRATRESFAKRVGSRSNFYLVDAEEDDGRKLEEVSAELATRARGRPSVLIADGLQTIRTIEEGDEDNPRLRIDARVQALKRCAKVDKHLVMVSSELARGAYRSRDSSERIDDLAAFKESGGIEYGVSVALVMRSVPDESALVDVSVPKNRLGPKEPFRLRLDHERARFTEETISTEDFEGEEDARAILQLLTNAGEWLSARKIERALGKRNQWAKVPLEQLRAEERVLWKALKGGVVYAAKPKTEGA